MENSRYRPCRCGNTILAGQLMEVKIGIRGGKRCLGCYVASPTRWWKRPRKRAMPYGLALKRYYALRKEQEQL